MNKFLSSVILLFVSQLAFSQYQIGLIPRVSPDKSVSQKIGYTDLKVTYGSPVVQNRDIWGELVPFDKVWRAGANNATTIEISSTISLNNTLLDRGTYALFMIPMENEKWTIIFNKIHKQWGAFKYQQIEDALRIEVLPRRTDYFSENLTYSINQIGYKYGSVVLNWEYLEIEIPFETNYIIQFKNEVETRAKQQPESIKWIVYLQGAEHLLQLRENQSLAMSWVDSAEQIMDSTSEWNEQFYPRDYIKGHLYWTKAKLLAESGNYKDAVAYVEKVKSLDNTIFYDKKNEEESIDRSLLTWQK